MLCLKCSKETPDTDVYCVHCGCKLDLTFDQVTEKLGADIKTERAEETEEFFQWILLMLIFFLISGMIFRSLWSDPPDLYLSPGYVPEVETKSDYENIHKPFIIRDK